MPLQEADQGYSVTPVLHVSTKCKVILHLSGIPRLHMFRYIKFKLTLCNDISSGTLSIQSLKNFCSKRPLYCIL